MTRLRGKKLNLWVGGTSHASRLDFRLTGLPDDFTVDDAKLAAFLERRAPGRDRLSTSRRESDSIHWIVRGQSGYILNENVRPGDYGKERTVPRPGHADFPQYVRYGRIPTGGGANSGRLTAAYCAAGGMCLQYLERRGISVAAKIVKCGDIAKAKREGDSVGGIIACEVKGVPVGLGGAMFEGLDGDIAKAVFAIPGVKGVAFGNGFAAADLKGSENNDAFVLANGEVRTRTNNHGGILGGFSSGMPIVFRVAMKPTPTIFREQNSVDLKTMKPAKLAMKGRHDPCIVRRAVPVVEAMAAFVMADRLLFHEEWLPRICLTLTGKTLAEDIAQFRSQKLFTDLVELRVDLLQRGEIAAAAMFPRMLAKAARRPVPVILTIRRVADGGVWRGGEKARTALFKKLLGVGFTYVDCESDFHALDNLAAKRGVKIVRSRHCFDGKIPKLEVAPGEILKLAVKGRDISTGVKLMNKFANCDCEHVVMMMGPEGFFTRALASWSRSKWVYASVGGLAELGHATPEELVRDFRFREFNVSGYGVTGWPLKKTRSPELHNAAFQSEGNESVMVPLPCADIRKVLKAMKDLDLSGLAVTIPHKESIMPLLDGIDPVAKAVGAVNTVLRNPRGKLYGYNTDVAGFTRAITEFIEDAVPPVGRRLRPRRHAWKVALLGNGGAAKACKYALERLGARVTVFHRTPLTPGFELIVNATPVDPIPEYRFRGEELVYDLRYVPEVTDLMARAAKAGCRVSNGFSMLRYQAEEQRRIWESRLSSIRLAWR